MEWDSEVEEVWWISFVVSFALIPGYKLACTFSKCDAWEVPFVWMSRSCYGMGLHNSLVKFVWIELVALA